MPQPDSEKVKGIVSLTKRGERKGKFYCLKCGKIFDNIMNLPNNGDGYTFRCNGCGDIKYIDAGMAAFIAIKKTQQENLLMGDIK